MIPSETEPEPEILHISITNNKLPSIIPTKSPTKSPTKLPTVKPINKWIVNWTLVDSPHNLTSSNVSESVIWINNNYNGYCGTQLYPILTNSTGFKYFWVHDVMSIENGNKLWIFVTDPSAVYNSFIQPSIWLGLYYSHIICAYNDGTTVISDEIKFMRRKNLDFIIIICDIPTSLKSYVLSSYYNTTIAVSLFDSRNRSLNIIKLNGENHIWLNVTIPVCSTLVVNRGQNVYFSDGDKYLKISKGNKNPIISEKRHFLSACLIIHPSGDHYNQMNIRIVEWIEYGLLMGFEHFYIYDHIDGINREFGDKFIWNNIYYYIKHGGKVTYIEWTFPYSEPWIFQYSFINSCLNRFKYDNNYISIIDVDEYLIPPKRFITVADVIKYINRETNKYVNMFVLKCKLSTTCQDKLGCNQYFNSFLERHACISHDNPPTNPKKYIINPMAMWYAFVHGIPRWKDNVDNVAKVFTEIGICLHARDHHKANTAYKNESVNHIIEWLQYSWKHEDIKIHPLFDKNRNYCPL